MLKKGSVAFVRHTAAVPWLLQTDKANGVAAAAWVAIVRLVDPGFLALPKLGREPHDYHQPRHCMVHYILACRTLLW